MRPMAPTSGRVLILLAREVLRSCAALSDLRYAIQVDGNGMVAMSDSLVPVRAKMPESEKITINLGHVDLGQVDLLVQDRFYANRTDFIRTAIRNQLDRHTDTVKQAVARHHLDLGLRRFDRDELERVKVAGEALHIQVLGLVVIADDVTPTLARETITSLQVLGALQAPAAVKAALHDRIR